MGEFSRGFKMLTNKLPKKAPKGAMPDSTQIGKMSGSKVKLLGDRNEQMKMLRAAEAELDAQNPKKK